MLLHIHLVQRSALVAQLLKEENTWEELHRQYLVQLNQVSTVQGLSFYILNSTCEQSQLHIFCILCLLARVACLFVVRAVVPAQDICIWIPFSKA